MGKKIYSSYYHYGYLKKSHSIYSISDILQTEHVLYVVIGCK